MSVREIGMRILISGLLSVSANAATTLNLIQQENAKPGTASWVIGSPAKDHEIEGYASLASVNRGNSISFFVNTNDSNYAADIYRMGWYGGKGARQMAHVARLGLKQPAPSVDYLTHLVQCNWLQPIVLRIPATKSTEWISGLYLVKLTAVPSGKQSYIAFVVRDDTRASDFLFQSSVATYEGYNTWGGWSLYTNPQAYKVSFDRPFASGEGFGAPQIFAGSWEYSTIRFLEREGDDVSYTTDVDTHEQSAPLLLHKGFLVVGHDEYWSWQMRDNVENARDHGVSLAFFGADLAYWQIRFEASTLTGAADRVMVCYKNGKLDPLYYDPSRSYLTTTAFRNPPVNRPEAAMVGVAFSYGHGENADMVITDANSWVFAGTGLKNGDHLKGLVGYEADAVTADSPKGVQVLAHSPYVVNKQNMYSDMVLYTSASGSLVMATGTLQWCWGLDAFPNPNYTNPEAQQATRNILSSFQKH